MVLVDIAQNSANKRVLVLSEEAKDILLRLFQRHKLYFDTMHEYRRQRVVSSSSINNIYPSLRPLTFNEQQQVQLYYHEVTCIAKGFLQRVPSTVEKEELISAGAFGLITAIQRYNAAKGDFITYARSRIEGAIRDYIRSLDEHYNKARQRFTKYKIASKELARQGIEQTVENIARWLEVPEDYIYRVKQEMTHKTIFFDDLSVSNVDKDNHSSSSSEENYPDPKISSDFADNVCLVQRLGYTAAGISTIEKEKVKMAINYKYIEQLELEMIAQLLHVTEPRVSQLFQEGIITLRKKIRHLTINYRLDTATLDDVVRRSIN